MSEGSYFGMNTTILAFIGDAAYEVRVRDHVLKSGTVRADSLHKAAVGYVRAEAQAKALRALMPILTDEETALVKRARNRKITSKPKNADPVEYKLATAFEALIGVHHLAGNIGRMEELIRLAIASIEEPEAL